MIGAAGGLLIGFFLVEFGLLEIAGGIGAQAIVLTGGLIGAALGALRLYWLPLAVSGFFLVAHFVIGNTPIMFRVAQGWVRADPLPQSADAIVVLSATINSDGYLSEQGVQRLLTGIELFQRGLAPRVFTTAVEERFGDEVKSSTADQERIIRMGGASASWTSFTGAFTTRDEALQSAAKLPEGTRGVIVVTSPMHTRRACATFEAVGFKVYCVPSREHGAVTWHPLHTADRLASFREYVYERLGMIKYGSKGWLPKT